MAGRPKATLPSVRLMVTLDPITAEAVSKAAAKDHRSQASWVRLAILAALLASDPSRRGELTEGDRQWADKQA